MNTSDVAEMAKVSYRQLTTWVEKGWLKPVEESGRGYGGKNFSWNSTEAELACRMGALVAAGMYPEKAHRVAKGDQGAVDRLLLAVAPCLKYGELRWRHNVAGDAGQTATRPCAVPPLPHCVGEEPCG